MGRLTEFIEYVLRAAVNDRRAENEKRSWELWLHKVWDQSYKEFQDAISGQAENQARAMQMEEADIEHAASVAFDTLALLEKGGQKPC